MGRNEVGLLNGLDTGLIEHGEAGGFAYAHFGARAVFVYQCENGAVAFLVQGP
jgi:hypothetical protein